MSIKFTSKSAWTTIVKLESIITQTVVIVFFLIAYLSYTITVSAADVISLINYNLLFLLCISGMVLYVVTLRVLSVSLHVSLW